MGLPFDVSRCWRLLFLAPQVAVWKGHSGPILKLLVLGNYVLSLGADRRVCLWKSGELQTTRILLLVTIFPPTCPFCSGEWSGPESQIELPDDFVPSCMCHPETYLNKVLLGAEDGRMQLWNVATGAWGNRLPLLSRRAPLASQPFRADVHQPTHHRQDAI